MKKANVIAALLIAVIAVLSVTPYAIAESEGKQLEFMDLYPASLTYHAGEEIALVCEVINTGSEDLEEEPTMSYTIIDPNGTMVYSFDFEYGLSICTPGKMVRSLSRFLWEVDENATGGKYTIEAVLRWDTNAIQKTAFFYVPEAPEETELEITRIYPARLAYQPGEKVRVVTKLENRGDRDIEYYISVCAFDRNGTMYSSIASAGATIEAGKKVIQIFVHFAPPEEEGIYTIEAIVWWAEKEGWADKAVSETCEFGVVTP